MKDEQSRKDICCSVDDGFCAESGGPVSCSKGGFGKVSKEVMSCEVLEGDDLGRVEKMRA